MTAEQFEIDLGKKLQLLRKVKGKTQAEVAEELGLKSRETVKQWESWDRHIKARDLIKLAEYYEVSSDYLLGISDVVTPDPDLRKVCEYTHLSEGAVMSLRDIEGLTDIIFAIGEDYETADGPGDITDALSRMLESNSGIEFLNALCLVKRAAEGAKKVTDWIKELDPEYKYDGLKRSLRELKLAIFELTNSARKLAQDLYHSDDVEQQLIEDARLVWENPHDPVVQGILTDLKEGMKNGKHQED